MNQEKQQNKELLQIRTKDSGEAFEGRIIVSLPEGSFYDKDKIKVIVGSTGQDNKSESLSVGDFVVYDTGMNEKFEIRIVNIFRLSGNEDFANVLVTKLK